MDIFAKIAEDRIRRAMEEGEFDSLSGSGKPLKLEDETWIPEDLRSCYRVLKNAGCIPRELELRKEIINLRDLIHTLDDDKERMRKIREMDFKIMQFNMLRKRPLSLDGFPEYEQRFFEKLAAE
jgi:hypothetical protein